MVHTFEAIIDENGAVELLDPIKLPARRRAFVTVLEDAPAAPAPRPYGLARGEFEVAADFDAPLPEDVLKDFEGS